MFLFRYGGDGRKIDARYKTSLHQNTILRTSGGRNGSGSGTADMSGVFKIDHCVAVFEACFARLFQKCQRPPKNNSHSILGYLVGANSLEEDREGCRCKIKVSARRRMGASILGLPPVGLTASSSESKKKYATSPAKRPVDDLFAATTRKFNWRKDNLMGVFEGRKRRKENQSQEEEANQLRASYGVKPDDVLQSIP